MKHRCKTRGLVPHLLSALVSSGALASPVNFAQFAQVQASSEAGRHSAENVADSVVSEESTWMPGPDPGPHWLELRFRSPEAPSEAHVFFSGLNGGPIPTGGFHFEEYDGHSWKALPASTSGSSELPCILRLQFQSPVRSRRIRMVSELEEGIGVTEMALFAESVEIGTGIQYTEPDGVLVCVNQIGYNSSLPKRFTVPGAADSSGPLRFSVVRLRDHEKVFSGLVEGGIGDFSAYRPEDETSEFVIELESEAEEIIGRSYPFRVAPSALEDSVVTPAVDFMIDARSVVGTHPSAYGGMPWRIGSRFSYELPSLALLYMAMPEELDALPRQINWEAAKRQVMDPDFRLTRTSRDHWVVRDVQSYFSNNSAPAAEAPDIAKLLHWGAGFIMERNHYVHASEGGIPRRSIEQLAYFLAVYPRIEQWIDPAFYRKCLEQTFSNWESCEALEVLNLWSQTDQLEPGTGRIGTGHSVLSNLLMHEVAKRELRSDSGIYLDAAVRQAAWIVNNVDLKDPRQTKRHRASEHKTVTGLVWLLQNYPEHAPRGLAGKLDEWATIAISRSNNMWDFRRYDLESNWSIPKYNEPGNLAGFPACALAVSWVIEDESKRQRLREIGVASWDALFGRNPLNAASPVRPELGWDGIERGWPSGSSDWGGGFGLVRGAINSSAPTSVYPFNPGGQLREIDLDPLNNSALNVGLAYIAWDKRQHASLAGFSSMIDSKTEVK